MHVGVRDGGFTQVITGGGGIIYMGVGVGDFTVV